MEVDNPENSIVTYNVEGRTSFLTWLHKERLKENEHWVIEHVRVKQGPSGNLVRYAVMYGPYQNKQSVTWTCNITQPPQTFRGI